MTGGALPAQTWHDIMVAAHQGVEVKELAGRGHGHEAADAARFRSQGGRERRAKDCGREARAAAGLTKRGADVLVQVEKMLDDADRTMGKTSSSGQPPPAKPGIVQRARDARKPCGGRRRVCALPA